jgi:enoyl-CoA hydratase
MLGNDMVLLVERDGPVAVVTLNRPEARNALNPELIEALGAAMLDLEADANVRAVVLTGAGRRAFCAGMDLRHFAAHGRQARSRPGLEVLTRRVYPKPIVAAVNGAALAGGLDLALSCDLIIAAEDATFGIPEVKRGLVALGASSRLAKRIPMSAALELGLTGDPVTALRAMHLGLVNRVVPSEDLIKEATELAHRIASNGPLAVNLTKELIISMPDLSDRATLERCRALIAPVFSSNDAKEGATAFIEKRPPQWTGT